MVMKITVTDHYAYLYIRQISVTWNCGDTLWEDLQNVRDREQFRYPATSFFEFATYHMVLPRRNGGARRAAWRY